MAYNAQHGNIRQIIRMRKEDSAFVYAIMESNEGTASCTTLPHEKGDPFRDVELRMTAGTETEVRETLENLEVEIEFLES